MPNREPKLPITRGGERAVALVIVRESSNYDRLLMEGMIGQAVSQVLHLPGAADVLAAGIAPLDDNGPFDIYEERLEGTHIVTFEHLGVVYLYCTGSTAKLNTGSGENFFIQFLCKTLATYEPVTTYAPLFYRMFRSPKAAVPLFNAVSKHTDSVTIGNLTMDLSTIAGKAMWTVMAWIGETDSNEIVKRFFSGKVFSYLQGEYIFGKEALPPGYILADDRTVQIDEPMVDGVRNLLEAMANHDLTARQVVDLAGSFGVTTPAIRRYQGEEATCADLHNADSCITSLIKWIPTYESGHTEICYPNPYLGATQFHSLIVEGATRKEPGFIRFAFDWPLPEGGWGDPDILAAAARRGTVWK